MRIVIVSDNNTNNNNHHHQNVCTTKKIKSGHVIAKNIIKDFEHKTNRNQYFRIFCFIYLLIFSREKTSSHTNDDTKMTQK